MFSDDQRPSNDRPREEGTDSDSTSGSSEPKNELPRWATRRQSGMTPLSEERMAAYIGPRWESTYRAKLSQFFEDPSFTVTWNWAAALGSPFWFFFRKLYATGIAFAMLPNIALGLVMTNTDASVLKNPESPEARQFLIMWGAVALSTAIAAGGTANWFLFRRARAASIVVTMQQVPEDVAISRLQRIGGVSIRAVILFCLASVFFANMAALAGAK